MSKPNFRELRAHEVRRMNLLRASVNRVSHHTSRSGWALLTVPSYSTLDGFPKRRRLLAERLFELGVIHHEGFLKLVEHLDRLADSWVEKTHSPQQHLRCSLDACWLADFLEDHLHEPARCERLGAG